MSATDDVSTTLADGDTEQRRVWFPEGPEDHPARRAKHRIADHVRDIVLRVSQLDAAALDEARLASLEEQVAQLSEHLGRLPAIQRETGAHASGADGNLFERSPLTGRSNPLAAPLRLEPADGRTLGHATYSAAYEGPAGAVHGGVVIAAFDDLLGVAQAASGLAGMTGTLTVRLVRPSPLHRRIDYEAGIERVEGRKITVWGRSQHGGELLAEASGIFIAPRT